MKRIFLALPIPEQVIDYLQRIQNGIPNTRWQIRENFHITLNFLGEVEEPQIDQLHESLSFIDQESFDVEVSGVGTFDLGKNKGPRILWAGVEKSESLLALKKKVDRAVEMSDMDIERRNYNPHITIGRMNNPPLDKVGEFISEYNLLKFAPFRVNEFILYESHLRPEGSLYVPMLRYPLK